MSEFVRARSSRQKEIRMEEIKTVTDTLFAERPYHEITLTTIAERLSWSRANLYKYVSTKEEIFLELCTEKRTDFFDALLAAFPEGCGYSLEVWAEVWAGLLNAHQDYLHYSDILSTIIETNVSVERLAEFKKNYYSDADRVLDRLEINLRIGREEANELFMSVYYHAMGLGGACSHNPLIKQAMEKANLKMPERNFKESMKKFIYMNLCYYCESYGK